MKLILVVLLIIYIAMITDSTPLSANLKDLETHQKREPEPYRFSASQKSEPEPYRFSLLKSVNQSHTDTPALKSVNQSHTDTPVLKSFGPKFI